MEKAYTIDGQPIVDPASLQDLDSTKGVASVLNQNVASLEGTATDEQAGDQAEVAKSALDMTAVKSFVGSNWLWLILTGAVLFFVFRGKK